MHRLIEMNRKNSTGGFVRLALAALAAIGLAAGPAVQAQVTSVPPVVFSRSSLLLVGSDERRRKRQPGRG